MGPRFLLGSSSLPSRNPRTNRGGIEVAKRTQRGGKELDPGCIKDHFPDIACRRCTKLGCCVAPMGQRGIYTVFYRHVAPTGQFLFKYMFPLSLSPLLVFNRDLLSARTNYTNNLRDLPFLTGASVSSGQRDRIKERDAFPDDQLVPVTQEECW